MSKRYSAKRLVEQHSRRSALRGQLMVAAYAVKMHVALIEPRLVAMRKLAEQLDKMVEEDRKADE